MKHGQFSSTNPVWSAARLRGAHPTSRSKEAAWMHFHGRSACRCISPAFRRSNQEPLALSVMGTVALHTWTEQKGHIISASCCQDLLAKVFWHLVTLLTAMILALAHKTSKISTKLSSSLCPCGAEEAGQALGFLPQPFLFASNPRVLCRLFHTCRQMKKMLF